MYEARIVAGPLLDRTISSDNDCDEIANWKPAHYLQVAAVVNPSNRLRFRNGTPITCLLSIDSFCRIRSNPALVTRKGEVPLLP